MSFSITRHQEEWSRYLQTRSIDDRNKLVVLNQPLARSRAAALWARCGRPKWTSVDELECVAIPRLIRAIELYDPAYLSQFSTYATRAVDRAITLFIARNVKLRSQNVHSLNHLEDQGFIPASEEEKASDLQVGVDWIPRLRPFLTEQQYNAIVMRYRERLKFREIGARLGITTQRAQQIWADAISRLKSVDENLLLQ